MLRAFLKENGIELGEEFMIGRNHYRVDKTTIGNYHLMYQHTDGEWYLATLSVNNLEQAEITKLTWKNGDIYYVPNLIDNSIEQLTYDDDYIDYQYSSMGLPCRTKEEAFNKLKKIQDYCKKEFT